MGKDSSSSLLIKPDIETSFISQKDLHNRLRAS